MSQDHLEHATAKLCHEIARLAEYIPQAGRAWHGQQGWAVRRGERTAVGRSGGTPADPTYAVAAWVIQQRQASYDDLKMVRSILRAVAKRMTPDKPAAQPEIRHCACGNLAPNRRHPETRDPECENCYGRRRRAAKAGR